MQALYRLVLFFGILAWCAGCSGGFRAGTGEQSEDNPGELYSTGTFGVSEARLAAIRDQRARQQRTVAGYPLAGLPTATSTNTMGIGGSCRTARAINAFNLTTVLVDACVSGAHVWNRLGPAPIWVYSHVLSSFGGRPVFVLREEKNWLEEVYAARTGGVLIVEQTNVFICHNCTVERRRY